MAKIEEIWYWIIGAEEKLPNNVIDYNINKEITKDASNVVNANNQTTTGMATVIPWVNAPKILAKTSVIWADWWGWEWWISTSILELSTSERAQTWSLSTFNTLDSSTLASDITVSSWEITSSTWWTYLVSFNIDTHNANVTSFDFMCRNFWDYSYVVYTNQSWKNGSLMWLTKMNANDYIKCYIEPYWNSCSPTVSITMVRLG